jgi:DNA ligase (NAD+)
VKVSRILELEALIKKHKALYYQGRPEITDFEFDKIEDELKKIDPENAALKIVGTTSSASDKIKHDKKMLSLEKTYVLDDLVSWMGIEAVLSTYKLDGISCSVVYENGKFLYAKTRGDGVFGENISPKVMWINSIPKLISLKNKVEIRGELYCTEEDFYHLSEEMISIGLDRPTSQRNIVAGLMGRKDNLELCRHIEFMAFDVILEDHTYFKKEEEKFQTLEKMHFQIPEIEIHQDRKSLEKVIEEAKDFMSNGEFQIDGLVFTYNQISLHEELGETAHHPRYKMAFKFPGESKITTLKEISWSVSRNGILTPVGEVEPVELSGAMISRVTLHNYGMVKQFNLKSNDKIEIIRSGEVIPKFLSVIESSNNEFKIPDTCPGCNSKVEIEDIRIYCRNRDCPDKNKEIILNFIQKIGIEDLSGKRLEELLKAKLVKNIPDLYKLKAEDLMTLEKVKDKLSNKLIESIQKTKESDLITFLSSLGITGGAYNKCEKVVQAGFDTVEKILMIDEEKLQTIESFAEKSSYEFSKSLQEKHNLIKELVGLGFVFAKQDKKVTAISGLKICITGALSEKRNVIEDRMRECSAIVVSSVSKNTDMLVTNETDPTSSKYKKALELKIKIITEKELMDLMNS